MKFYETIKEKLESKSIKSSFNLYDFYDIYAETESKRLISLDRILEESPIPLTKAVNLITEQIPRVPSIKLAHIGVRDIILLGSNL